VADVTSGILEVDPPAMSASQILQRLYSLDTSSPDISRLIYGLIRHDEEEQYLSSLQGSELARLIDFLDQVRTPLPASHLVTKQILQALDTIGTTDDVFRRCLRRLQVICSGSMTLPSSYTISGDLARIGDEAAAFGGFADVWEGAHRGTKVCIKALRVTSSDDLILTKVRTGAPFPRVCVCCSIIHHSARWPEVSPMYYIVASYYVKGLIVKSSMQLTISKTRLGHRKGIKEKGKSNKKGAPR